jgi:hypothetical protein
MTCTPGESFGPRTGGCPGSALSSPLSFDWSENLFALNPGRSVSKGKKELERRCRGRRRYSTSQSTTNGHTVSVTTVSVTVGSRVSIRCGRGILWTAVGGAQGSAPSGCVGRKTFTAFARLVPSRTGKSLRLGRRFTGSAPGSPVPRTVTSGRWWTCVSGLARV